jgi:hypothetical protein
MDSILFLVRVWRLASGGTNEFRASVRAVDSDRTQLFTTPAELAHYLDETSQMSVDGLDGGNDEQSGGFLARTK